MAKNATAVEDKDNMFSKVQLLRMPQPDTMATFTESSPFFETSRGKEVATNFNQTGINDKRKPLDTVISRFLKNERASLNSRKGYRE